MQAANASLTHSYRHNGAESKPSVDLETGITVLYTASHPNSYSVSKSFVYDELAAMSLSGILFRPFFVCDFVVSDAHGSGGEPEIP